MKIDITGLKKEQVILALFKNVNWKSGAALETRRMINDRVFEGSPAPIGLDDCPTEAQISNMLAESQKCDGYMWFDWYIDYIGPVCFKISFSDNVIDVSHYDTLHKTDSTPGILTAAACIEKMREDLSAAAEAEEKASAQRLILTETLSTFLGTEITLTNDKFMDDTRVSIGKSYSDDKFTIPGKVATILEVLSGDGRDAFLAKIKEQYTAIVIAKTQLAFVRNALKETLGLDVRVASYDFMQDTTVRIARGLMDYDVFDTGFSIPGKIPYIFDVLKSDDCEDYLAKVKEQYDCYIKEKSKNSKAPSSFATTGHVMFSSKPAEPKTVLSIPNPTDMPPP